jgi:uncharacterized protein (DUF2141 family)
MNKVFMMTGIAALCMSTTKALSDNSQKQIRTGDLTVVVDGFENDRGYVKIGLHNSVGSYTRDDDKYIIMGIMARINNGKVIHSFCFREVPFGVYAVSIFHDENANGRLDKNLFGAPTESYGFSNNARATFSRPDFKEAAFVLNKSDMTIRIHVK